MPTTTIEGNITQDLTLKEFPSGSRVINFGVAVNTGIKQTDGSWKDNTEYFECAVWDRLADNAIASLTKGDTVIVTGNLKQRSWEAADGSKRSRVELNVQGIGPSLRWGKTSFAKNPKLSVDAADEAGEAVVVKDQPPVEPVADAAVDPMSAPF